MSFRAHSGDNESTKMVRELQATTGAEVSKNGHGIEGRREGTLRFEAYPREELEPASSSSAETRKSEEERRQEGALCSGIDGIGGGVKWR